MCTVCNERQSTGSYITWQRFYGCKEYKETKKWPDDQKQVAIKALVELNTFVQNQTHNICRRLITRHFSQSILWWLQLVS